MIQSHTATQQWQSFEMKMRRRRLERCLLRASVAIEAGVLEDAAEALEEAARLDPNEPLVQELASRLTAAQAALSTQPPMMAPAGEVPIAVTAPAAEVPIRFIETPPAHVAPARSGVLAGIFAVALIALSGLAGWWWTISRNAAATPVAAPAAPAPAAVDKPAAPPLAGADDPSVRISETSLTLPVGTAEAPADETPVAPSGPVTPVTPVATTGPPAAPATAAAASPVPDPRSGSRLESAPPDRPRPEAAAPEYTARPVLGTSVADATVAAAPTLPAAPAPAPAAPMVPATEGIAAAPDGAIRITAPPAPAAAPAAAASTAADEQTIRGVLGRYEAAYSRLDAAAASSVWPGVNQRALASAFQGLESQSISLGQCDIRVNGAAAQAQCTGSARWTPKVGAGAQSASRQWRFDLRNTGGTWVITQATTR